MLQIEATPSDAASPVSVTKPFSHTLEAHARVQHECDTNYGLKLKVAIVSSLTLAAAPAIPMYFGPADSFKTMKENARAEHIDGDLLDRGDPCPVPRI